MLHHKLHVPALTIASRTANDMRHERISSSCIVGMLSFASRSFTRSFNSIFTLAGTSGHVRFGSSSTSFFASSLVKIYSVLVSTFKTPPLSLVTSTYIESPPLKQVVASRPSHVFLWHISQDLGHRELREVICVYLERSGRLVVMLESHGSKCRGTAHPGA